jgi:hypothetical protein
MTIKQLIEQLSKFNPDHEIRFSSYLESGFGSWSGCTSMQGPFIELDEVNEDVVEVHFQGEIDIED